MRRMIGAALTAVILLAVPATASAEKFLSRKQAKQNTKQVVRERYGDDLLYPPIYVSCDPTGREYDPDYVYSSWSCTWTAESAYRGEGWCDGRLRIKGASGRGWFKWSVIYGKRCET